MKTKNGILAVAAVVLAVGTAFAFSAPPAAPWVKVRFLGDPAGQFRCIQTALSCQNATGVTCKVTVADINQATKGYANSSCDNAAVLLNSSATSVGTFDPSETIIEAAPY